MQSFSHHGEDEVSLGCAGIHSLLADLECRPAGCQIPAGGQHVRLARISCIVAVALGDVLELLCDTGTLASYLLSMQIIWVGILLGTVQIPVRSDQLPDALLHLRPFQGDGVLALFQRDTLAVVILPDAGAGDCVGMATDAVFVFQETDVFLSALALLELLVNAKLALRDAAAACQHIVDGSLGKREARLLFSLCLFNERYLLCLRGEGAFLRAKPAIHKDHAIDRGRHSIPAHEDFHLTAHVRAAPHGQHVVIGTVSSPLAIGENLLNEGAIEVAANEIAAFLAVLMVGKVRGNRHSMIFQGVGNAEKLLLLIAVVVRYFASGVKVVTAGLEGRRFGFLLRLVVQA